MKYLKMTFLTTLISTSLFFIGCSKDDDDSNNGNINVATASCSDGIKNQDETGVDCGGVCPPCASATSSISFKIDGEAAVISDFDANRNPFNNPSIIGLIALTDKGNRFSITLEEPAVTGWSDGLSFLSLDLPNQIIYEVTDTNGNSTFYSSANGNNAEEVSFLKLEYKEGGLVKGRFSGVLDDGNGNTITIEDGEFDTVFVN